MLFLYVINRHSVYIFLYMFADFFGVWSLCILLAVFCFLSSTNAQDNINNSLAVAQISKGSERFALELLQVSDDFDFMSMQRFKHRIFSAPLTIFAPRLRLHYIAVFDLVAASSYCRRFQWKYIHPTPECTWTAK